jgi:hypothetical protein
MVPKERAYLQNPKVEEGNNKFNSNQNNHFIIKMSSRTSKRIQLANFNKGRSYSLLQSDNQVFQK